MRDDYMSFLKNKSEVLAVEPCIEGVEISKSLFPFQKDCCEMLLRAGKGGAFLDTGLGKTILQCEWARHIPGSVLIVAPLAVAQQTVKEARDKLDMEIVYSRDGTTGNNPVTITNYERVDNFDCGQFKGVVLDESSILKSFMGKTKNTLCAQFESTPYKLACTATPAPNDYMELGNHSEFLNAMGSNEMLARWFINDTMNFGSYRLKNHAVKPFWEWVSSWAACVSKPSDLGYDDGLFELPELRIETHTVTKETKTAYDDGLLFDLPSVNASSLHADKRDTVHDRVGLVSDMVNANNDPWIVWCESNQESEMLAKAIPGAVEVKGSHPIDTKESRLMDFSEGRARVIVSKPSICGFGMNWQHCNNIAFASISYSYEKFYQAVRRSWRFGQKKPVNVHVVIADSELQVWRTVEKKATNHSAMKDHMKHAVFNKGSDSSVKVDYNPNHKATLPDWITSGELTETS